MLLRALTYFGLLLVSLHAAAGAAELRTRYGRLSTDDLNLLLFRGVAVSPRIEGNNFLTFEKKFEFSGYDPVLVQDVGGTACPAQFYVIKLARIGASPTPSFGTCADLFEVKRTPKRMVVQMRVFLGPFEGSASQARAAKRRFAYTYSGGTIVEERIW